MHHAIKLRLDVERFLWPVYYEYSALYYAGPLFRILGTVLHLSEDIVQREFFEGSNFRG